MRMTWSDNLLLFNLTTRLYPVFTSGDRPVNNTPFKHI